jgi:hypothetical protein
MHAALRQKYPAKFETIEFLAIIKNENELFKKWIINIGLGDNNDNNLQPAQ